MGEVLYTVYVSVAGDEFEATLFDSDGDSIGTAYGETVSAALAQLAKESE